jgi:DNA-binding MurR/RpiR family transcriptional regulator
VTSNSNYASEAAIRRLMQKHGIDRFEAIRLYLKQRIEGLG